MSVVNSDAKAIFFEALELETELELASFLKNKCGDNAELRDRVDELFRAYERAGKFLGGSLSDSVSTDIPSKSEQPGTLIGPYKLMEQIGEGGMGTVFVAQQERPIRRRVALKLIKAGMDSKAVVARFEAERQALAMMDHANIAKVLDAGTTDSGRPYFAMELVKGIPITEYCDKNRLTVSERLDLFVQVCNAIQHAHQKGIIHRDIKPSNVLITLHDGKPVPKVIDFGVAKAINARLTDKTIYTEHFQVVGTLLYMSPEQAELSGLDIDTRSDIYSLGVLLYELLTGTTPFQQEELRGAGFDEQRRIIRQMEPPRASVRISSLGETATTVADARKTEAKRLQELVRGELDWVILKGLDKDRTRRYETATSFAHDIQRYLAGDAVQAHPPSALYRARKFASRNRIALATLSLVLVSLCLGLGAAIRQTRIAIEQRAIATIAARDANHQKQIAIEQAEAAMLAEQGKSEAIYQLEESAIQLAKFASWLGDTEGMNAAIEVVRKNPDRLHDVLQIEGLLLFTQGHLEPAREKFEQALELDPSDYFSQAFLTKTAINAGESGRFALELSTLDSMRPKDDYDRLAQASVEIFRDPFRALQLLDKVGHGARGIGKLLIQADAEVHTALDSGSLDYCDQCLDDYDSIEIILGPNGDTLCSRLLICTFAMYVARSNGEMERAIDYGKRAKKVNQQLVDGNIDGKYDDSLVHSIQWHYYQYGPEPDPGLAWQSVKKVSVNADYVINIATDRMVNEPDPQKALDDYMELVGGVSTPYSQFAKALLMASIPDRSHDVATIASDLAEQDNAVYRMYSLILYALLGDRNAARQVAIDTMSYDETRFMLAGELQAVKAFAKPGKFESFAELGDRDRLIYARSKLTQGLLAVCEGEGQEGYDAFVAAQESQMKIYYLDMMASAFEHQMKHNPQWPCGRSVAAQLDQPVASQEQDQGSTK